MHTVVCLNIRCNKRDKNIHPVYRIFLDDHLVIERRFWATAPDYFIQEQLTLNNDGNEHNIYVKNIFEDRGEIYTHDVKFFNGEDKSRIEVEYEFVDEKQFTFKLPKR